MEEVTGLKKTVFKKVFLFSIPIALLLVVLGRPFMAVSYLFGIGIGCLNIHLLSLDLLKVDFKDQSSPGKTLLKSFILRYVMLFLAFAVVFMYRLHIVGFIVGFFKVKIILAISQAAERQQNEN